GLRPLVSPSDTDDTAALSRDHTIYISRTGLVTITGGKWTTYRKMAEDTIDHAATVAHLPDRTSISRDLHIHGYHNHAEKFGDLAVYGSDAPAIKDLLYQQPELKQPLHPNMTTIAGEVVWAVRKEMARTIEDFLARRTRALLLDARASIEMAPKVARLMADELQKDDAWVETQVQQYRELARGYLLE
ncbi:MAG: glycerol-3-phosphate dehydrogenase C-terminal domain-containing protein, partial [Thermodesulfobacteriota bacterium]